MIPVTATPLDRFQYACDRDGDVVSKNNLVVTADSELYAANGTSAGSAYDALGRLTNFALCRMSSGGGIVFELRRYPNRNGVRSGS